MLTANEHRIIDEAFTWIDTPYRDKGREKGRGVDCAGLIICVGLACGAEGKDYNNYATLPERPKLLAALDRHCDRCDIGPGRIVMFRYFSEPQHIGIITHRKTFIHAQNSHDKSMNKVLETRLAAHWLERPRFVGCWAYRWPS